MTGVVVTGIGAVTCHGRGAAALWASMKASVPRPPDRPADPLAHMDLPLIHLVPDAGDDGSGYGVAGDGGSGYGDDPGRAFGFAAAAVDEALRDAALSPADLARSRAAVVVGSCMGEVAVWERGRGRTEDAWNPAFQVASRVADRLAVFGAGTSVANACAAGGFAVTMAADMIRCGEADVVLAGGSDAYSRIALACFNRLGAVDPVRCRPFDLHRSGTIFGEGAGMLVLESAAHAAARGAAPAARIAGSGWSCDAHHPTAPEPDGGQQARAAREALAEAGADDRVGCVIPHGTGTRLNDVVESNALRAVLGAALDRVPLYSLKALVGHTGGAASALAACAAVMILRAGSVPPNVPLDEQDPDCAVLLPQDGPVLLAEPRVLINGYAFGGNNCSLVLEAGA